jgi:hypothetical protein
MKIIFAAIVSLFFLTAGSQTPLVPGKKSFDKKWIKNQSYQMNWYASRDTVKVQIGEVSTRILADKKHLAVITVVKMKNSKEPWIDTTIAAIETLSPVYHSSYNVQRNIALNFGEIVTGFYHDKIKLQHSNISDTTSAAYFDSNIYPLLISWLPLKEGFTQTISIYDYNPSGTQGVMKAQIKEVKSGVLETTLSGSQPVWIVTVTDEISYQAGNFIVYYLGKEDRKLWKQEINAAGRKMILLSSEKNKQL